jgi:hypothetical protein
VNHYDILEVSPKASVEVIRAAYKSLMQRNHPDRNSGVVESTARTATISRAYEVLSNPEQRRVYDETFLERPPGHRPVSNLGRHNKPASSSRLRTWYAWVLILSVIGAGGAILVLSKRKTVQPPAAQEFRPSLPQVAGKPEPVLDAGESVADLQARTMSAFVTDLRIELIPSDGAQSGFAHVLLIPDLGLRLAPGMSDRYRPRLTDQRSQIIQQLLATLSKVPYHELIKSDADLYLRKLIEQSVAASIGLDVLPALPAASLPLQAAQWPLEALLPLSFSIR